MNQDTADHVYAIWAKFSIASMVAAWTIFFVFTVYRIILYHCLSSRDLPSSAPNSENHPNLESGGLSTEAIQSLPVVQLSNEIKEITDKSPDCAICLGVFEKGELLRLLPNCSHFFHVHCIDTWLSSHSNCPLCRMQVLCGVKGTCSSISVATSSETQTREEIEIQQETHVDFHLLALEASEM